MKIHTANKLPVTHVVFGHFLLDQIFRFEIPGISCDEWKSKSSGSKFRAKIRNQTEDFLPLFTFASGLLDDSEVEINDVLGEDDNITFIVRI